MYTLNACFIVVQIANISCAGCTDACKNTSAVTHWKSGQALCSSIGDGTTIFHPPQPPVAKQQVNTVYQKFESTLSVFQSQRTFLVIPRAL